MNSGRDNDAPLVFDRPGCPWRGGSPILQACAKIMTGALSPSPSGRNELLVASRMISSTTSLAVEPAITTFGFLDNLIVFVVWHLYRHSVLVKDAVGVAPQIVVREE
jgi:hypothetical protein